jgi:hypothetical protein
MTPYELFVIVNTHPAWLSMWLVLGIYLGWRWREKR